MKSLPAWAERLLRAICPEELFEQIEGDLIEIYNYEVKRLGKRKAKFRFFLSCFRFFRPGILLRNNYSIQRINVIMLLNYSKISFRNIRQSPLYSFINMLSLTIGISSCLVIYLFISDELSFDSFHSNKETIYRIYSVPHYSGNGTQKIALTNGWTGPSMAEDFTQVVNFTRYWTQGKTAFKNGELQFLINSVATVDSTFLDIFDFELEFGNRASALDKPNSVILTEETALKFFKNPIESVGKVITIQDSEYEVTGVLKNIPENSHLRFDALLPISNSARNNRMFNSTWEGSFLNTYVRLQANTEKKELESKFSDFWIRHTGITDPDKGTTLLLQPLSEIHLKSWDMDHDYNNYRKFNYTYLKVFGITGIFVLFIACVNFVNLTTARASYRWKEIGIRKSVGARKSQLFGQFIFESAMLALFALASALLLDVILLPYINQITARQLELSSLLVHPIQFALLLVAAIFLGLLTGIYPSLYITSFDVNRVLKGGDTTQGKSIFQSSMVVLQFGLAIGLMISTLIIHQQLTFMKNADIGFNKDQIMLIGMNKEVNEKLQVLRTEWTHYQFVKGVTASSQRLGNNLNGWGFKVKTDAGIYNFVPSNLNVDFDYLKVYEIEIKEGRDFSRDFPTDNGMAFLINETMARELHLKEPIGTPAGQSWYEDNSLGSIIGITRDFNYNSLYSKIGMLAIVCKPEWGFDEISIKIDGTQVEETIATIKEVWDKNISTYPFNYTFLDEHFDKLYRADQQAGSVISITSILAIFISCMGLFGLVAITMNRKIKEIGIRKLLGATNIEISSMLSASFAKLILISFIVICPITYYLLFKWLENFSYRISISLWVFLTGGFIAIMIAMLTVGYHTIKSSRENPVNSLRYE